MEGYENFGLLLDQCHVPIMHETLSWNGTCIATLSATGKQVRDIPESMLNTDLSSMVDSNPSAVVNKIQAVGISADWITTGKLTVLDNDDNIIFEADKDNETVQIAGFNVDSAGLHNDSPDTQFDITNDGYIYLEEKNVATPDRAQLSEKQLAIYGGDLNIVIDKVSVLVEDTSGAANYSDLSANGLQVSDGTTYNETNVTKTSVSTTDGTNTTTQTATGVTFDDGTASSKMSVIKRTLDSAGTTNITLQRGMYLAIVTHTNNTTAGQQGLYVIQAYDTNSVVLTISAAANSTLSISGLTLTWTTTNTYRALRLIYLS